MCSASCSSHTLSDSMPPCRVRSTIVSTDAAATVSSHRPRPPTTSRGMSASLDSGMTNSGRFARFSSASLATSSRLIWAAISGVTRLRTIATDAPRPVALRNAFHGTASPYRAGVVTKSHKSEASRRSSATSRFSPRTESRSGLSTMTRPRGTASTEAVPRGLVIVDSPDLDSVRGENREVAEDLLEASDLWLFVTTPARYGDAVPWNALRKATGRGASVAIVLNRVTPEIAAQIRRELVARLAEENLANLPLFVIPESSEADIPRDVVGGLGRWLDTVAAASVDTIVERTLHGGIESLKVWLEQLAEHMDDQAAAAKEVRAEVRRCAAKAEVGDGEDWHLTIGKGPVESRWRQAITERGPLFRVSNSWWVKRRSAREARDATFVEIHADLLAAVEAALAHAAASATDRMMASLNSQKGGVGPWLAEQRDPRDARV